jgi:hypothetical protein
MATLDELKKIFHQRGGFEVLEAKATETQIRLEGRVPPNAQRYFLLVMDSVFDVVESRGWTIDWSRHYFRRKVGVGNKFLYAHRIIFQFQAVESGVVMDALVHAVQNSARPNRVELQEFPLSGAGAHRTATTGRGAYLADKAPLGPQNVQRGVQR